MEEDNNDGQEDNQLVQRSSDVDHDTSDGTPSIAVQRSDSLLFVYPCGPCQEGDTNIILNAEWFCHDCRECFCLGCKSDHDDLKMVQNHNVNKLPLSCGQCGRKQTTTEAEWYCNECKEYLCSHCKTLHLKFKITKHHGPNSLDDRKQCNREQSILRGAKAKESSVFQPGVKELDLTHLQSISTHKTDMLDILNTSRESEAEETSLQQSKTKISNLRQLQSASKNIADRNRSRRSETENKSVIRSLSYILSLGILCIAIIASFWPSFSPSSEQQKKPFLERTAKPLAEINVTVHDDTSKPGIVSSSFLPDGRLLLLDWVNKKLKMLDKKLHFIKQEKIGVTPLEIAVYDENEIVVTLNNKSIARLSVNKDIIIKKSMSVWFDCWGVDYLNKDTLIVTGWDPDMLYVMTTEGQVQSRISSVSAGNQLFEYPWYMTVDRTRSRVFVSNWYSNTVCALDFVANNDVMFTYKPKNLLCVAGVAVDQEGNLYICGRDSSNIHVVGPEGQYIKTLLSAKDGLDRPRTISFTPSGDYFIVGSSENGAGDIVQMYTLQ